MHQQTFAEVTFEQSRKSTRYERFLDEMNRVVPWGELMVVIEPVYPKAEGPPEMHETKKGNQWYFGMKAPIGVGVDSRTKLIHSVAVTEANVHDSQVLPELLLHGQETRVWGDAA